MIAVIILIGVISVILSALCSMSEAAILSVTLAHAKSVANTGSKRGKIIVALKENTPKTVSVILVVNTMVNIFGAAVIGSSSQDEFGDFGLFIVSLVFTLAILLFGEILPKQIGFVYNKAVSIAMAYPLMWITKILSPMVSLALKIGKIVGVKQAEVTVSVEELLALADIGAREGVFDSLEGSIIKNTVRLDEILVRDILTPRVVVFRLEENTKIGELRESIHTWQHSRIPIYKKDDPDHVTHYVTQRDIYRAFLSEEDDMLITNFARLIYVAPELTAIDILLNIMVTKREHIAAVIDEHGGFAGVVTLEDIIEEIVGKEILDEYDLVEDMRQHASMLNRFDRRRLLLRSRYSAGS